MGKSLTVEWVEAATLTLTHRPQSGASLLHRAVGTGDVELVTLLLDRGADPNDRAAWVSPRELAAQ